MFAFRYVFLVEYFELLQNILYAKCFMLLQLLRILRTVKTDFKYWGFDKL